VRNQGISDENEDELSRLITTIASKFPEPEDVKDLLRKIVRLKDNSIFQKLAALTNADSSYPQLREAQVCYVVRLLRSWLQSK
jgi:hypothetical protein